MEKLLWGRYDAVTCRGIDRTWSRNFSFFFVEATGPLSC